MASEPAPSRWMVKASAVASAVACLVVLAACGGGGGPADEDEGRGEETARSAFEEGFEAGQEVLEEHGKGAAVRETVWGGCEKRAEEAGTGYPDDWVRGCRKGVQTFSGG
ncbi:hypothetical protein [Streptomyces griseocarneus]|uniref:hypothetical protein n=1 Tax=Streptomyces griseocarneus TaxID=51201 RepID=UPI00167CE72A|nr:hypothetical protein [Streptomyces griseocarneus]MBZ6476322.1 hypothetical protein [Streptomyces griseocarneus]GHG78185.1 hypothetical protein GCM10018779_57810 [Streptomyces griseocarneus]